MLRTSHGRDAMVCDVCGEIAPLPPVGTDPYADDGGGWPNLESVCAGPELRAGEDAGVAAGAATALRGDALTAGHDGHAANGGRATVGARSERDRLAAVQETGHTRQNPTITFDGRVREIIADEHIREWRRIFDDAGVPPGAGVAGDERRAGNAPTAEDKAQPEKAGGSAHSPTVGRLRTAVNRTGQFIDTVCCEDADGVRVTHPWNLRCDIEAEADRAALLDLRAELAEILLWFEEAAPSAVKASLRAALLRAMRRAP